MGDFTDEITEGFKSGSPYSDMSTSSVELPSESQKEIFHL